MSRAATPGMVPAADEFRPRSTETALESALMDIHGAACALYELMPNNLERDQLMTGINYLAGMILAGANEAQQAYYTGRGESFP